jgi:hypothetical protein
MTSHEGNNHNDNKEIVDLIKAEFSHLKGHIKVIEEQMRRLV